MTTMMRELRINPFIALTYSGMVYYSFFEREVAEPVTTQFGPAVEAYPVIRYVESDADVEHLTRIIWAAVLALRPPWSVEDWNDAKRHGLCSKFRQLSAGLISSNQLRRILDILEEE